MDLSKIVGILADPISLEPLSAERDPSGALTTISSRQGPLPLNDGILDLRPTDEDMIRKYGQSNFSIWKELQRVAEQSHSVRIEGHFSTENYASAKVYGEIVAKLSAGQFLDIGCGILPLPVYMQIADNHSYIGVDPVGLPAERKFPFVQALGDFLPFQNEVFDGVMFSSSLDHTINPRRALKEALRVLKTNGYCIVLETVREQNAKYDRWLTQVRYGIAQYDLHHNWAFTVDDFLALAREFELDILSIDHIPGSKECIYVLRKPTQSSLADRLYGNDAQSAKIEALARDWATIDFRDTLAAASKYARGMHDFSFEFYRKRISQLNLGGGKVYDAGGGTGTWSFAMAPDFDSVLCIDMNEDRIQLAKEMQQNFGIDNIDFRCGDMLQSGLPDNAVDVVFCYGVVISYLEFEEVFAEFHRILKPGGRIYACVNGLGWWKQLVDHAAGNESRKTIGYRGIYKTICRKERDAIIDGLRNFNTILADTISRNQLANEVGVSQPMLRDVFRSLRKIRGEDDPNAHNIFNLLRESSLAAAHDEIPRTIVMHCDRWGEFQGRLLKTFDEVSEHCIAAFEWSFLRDLSLIFIGKTDEFSFAKAGRSYEPRLIGRTLKQIGFSDFEWDVEGGLDRRSINEPRFIKETPMFSGRYGGDLAVWEFTAIKDC